MRKNTILMGIFAFLIFFILIYIGYGIKKEESKYKGLEADLVEASYAYFKSENLSLINDDVIKIKDSDLINKGLLEKLTVDGDECTGYVKVSKKNKKINYKAYIKCKNYETKED